MLSFRQFLAESLNTISQQQALDRHMFGPVYHGTSDDRRSHIMRGGFQVSGGEAGKVNGYDLKVYWTADGAPAPTDHLGYGVYFTTSRNIAKKYNGGTAKGLKEFYLDCPKLKTINFGAEHTMMKWWRSMGYDYDIHKGLNAAERDRATRHMTDHLKSQFDAVWFKGKGMHQLLDGDQVCCYDPANIYLVDPKLAGAMEVGSKVVCTGCQNGGTKGVIVNKRPIGDETRHFHPSLKPDDHHWYSVKWQRGGTQHNYFDHDLQSVGA